MNSCVCHDAVDTLSMEFSYINFLSSYQPVACMVFRNRRGRIREKERVK